MQMIEYYKARWAGSDKFAGDWEGPFSTYEDAKAVMDEKVAERKRNGEKYHMEVVRVTEVGMASTCGVGKR